jgi:Lysylphosphatidylglycerol synthase TM region
MRNRSSQVFGVVRIDTFHEAVYDVVLCIGRNNSLGRPPARFTYAAAISVTAMCAFFAQVVPGLVSEGIRVWIISRFGYSLREAFSSVVLDRGVGVAVLVAYVIAILFLPSPLATLLGYREIVLIIFCGALGIGIIALLLTPRLAPLLQRWRSPIG